ncbi:corrinoid protein [Clostridia bacterium OttesenSCG-928-O13]|nr:corrinoid protein [Clostridia bacterium OttesenSCG-928-O13]
MDEKLNQIAELIQEGEMDDIADAVEGALNAGVSAPDILNKMIETMGVVGDLFQQDELYVPEMLVSATTMKAGVEVLQPHLAGQAVESPGTCVIGTVAGDLHDIGKNLVALMIESAGFKVIDLGVDVPPKKFVETVQQNPDCNIVGVSALLTTTMASMKTTVEALRAAGVDSQVKIIVGGAPITQAFADEIGADGFSQDAAEAASLAARLVG